MRYAGLALVVGVLVGACDDTTPVCVPLQPAPCDCPTGRPGEQRCADDGLSFGACACSLDAGVEDDAGEDDDAQSTPDAGVD